MIAMISAGLANAQEAKQGPAAKAVDNIQDRRIGDWLVRCEVQENADPICVMTQQVNRPNTQDPLLQANFARNDELTLMTLQLPLGVYLPNGVIIQIDDFEARKFDIHFCTQQGCYVNLTLEPDFVSLLRRKVAAKITLFRTDTDSIEGDMSLTGFYDAYELL